MTQSRYYDEGPIIVSGTVAATQSGAWTVTVNQGTSPWVVSGTVAATQSGAWTVTANQGTSPWVVSGTVVVTQGTSPWVVSGTVAVSNPGLTDEQEAILQSIADMSGERDLALGPGSQVTVTAVASEIIPANAARGAFSIQHISGDPVRIGDSTVSSTTGLARMRVRDRGWDKGPLIAKEAIWAVIESGTTATLLVNEQENIDLQPFNWHTGFTFPWAHSYWAHDLASGAVAAWADGSGSANLVQATPASKPVITASNPLFASKKTVGFDGVDDFMATLAKWTLMPQPFTVVVVGRFAAALPSTLIYDSFDAADRALIYLSSPTQIALFAAIPADVQAVDGLAHLWTARFNSTASRWIQDGVVNSPINPGGNGLSGLHLGSNFNGTGGNAALEIAFIGFYPASLTPTEEAEIAAQALADYGVG